MVGETDVLLLNSQVWQYSVSDFPSQTTLASDGHFDQAVCEIICAALQTDTGRAEFIDRYAFWRKPVIKFDRSNGLFLYFFEILPPTWHCRCRDSVLVWCSRIPQRLLWTGASNPVESPLVFHSVLKFSLLIAMPTQFVIFARAPFFPPFTHRVHGLAESRCGSLSCRRVHDQAMSLLRQPIVSPHCFLPSARRPAWLGASIAPFPAHQRPAHPKMGFPAATGSNPRDPRTVAVGYTWPEL